MFAAGVQRHKDILIGLSLFTAAILMRLPFQTSVLYAWDSVLYARALQGFDITVQKPQAPGYIFYVGTSWLASHFLPSANQSYVAVSILFAALAIVVTYYLGKMMCDRLVGLAAALLLLTSPGFWFYSEVAYPYTVLAFGSVALAALFYRVPRSGLLYLVGSALAFGLIGGFRQDLLLFLAPLFVASIWGKPLSHHALAFSAFILGCLAWYIPSALLSGGFQAYNQALLLQLQYANLVSSIFRGDLDWVYRNFIPLGEFSLRSLYLAIGPLLYLGIRKALQRQRLQTQGFPFLAIWGAPSLLFYAFIHAGDQGYVHTFLPAALILAAQAIKPIGADLYYLLKRISIQRTWLSSTILRASLGFILILSNIGIFLFLDVPRTAAEVRYHNTSMATKIALIKKSFPPAETVIVADYLQQHANYFLPQYYLIKYEPRSRSNRSYSLPPTARYVLFLGPDVAFRRLDTLRSYPITRKERLYFYQVNSRQRIGYEGRLLSVN